VERAVLDPDLDQDYISVPEQYGSVIDRYKGSNGRLIVYIQDAHANYDGQRNLAYILESVIKDTGVDLVFREGMSTDKDLNSLRDYGSDKARRDAAEDLLKSAEITGEEYLELTSSYPLYFRGLEERALYEEQKNMLWKMDKIRDAGSDYIDSLIAAAQTIKPHIYTKELLELDEKKKDYDDGKIDLLEYYQYLYGLAEANAAPLYVFPNLGNLIKAGEIEKKIDMVRIRSGEAVAGDMAMYDEYTKVVKDINISALFKEEPKLEDFLSGILVKNSDQRQLLKLSKALYVMKNLMRIKVVPEEYEYFLSNKKDFDPIFWTDYISKKSEELYLGIDIPENYFVIKDNLPDIEKFYDIAFRRDEVFLSKIEENLKDGDTNMAVLIAGGFHTPALTRLLADRGYSYVVISPKVITETDDALYRSTFIR
jgi:hypothetical protein